jgi:hypothetical protein
MVFQQHHLTKCQLTYTNEIPAAARVLCMTASRQLTHGPRYPEPG